MYLGTISPRFNQTFYFTLTKPSYPLWFGAYSKLRFYWNLWFSLLVTPSVSLTRLFQKQLSQLVWLLNPWVSQRYSSLSSWSTPLHQDWFSLTFVSSSLFPLYQHLKLPLLLEEQSNLFIWGCLSEHNKATCVCVSFTAGSSQQNDSFPLGTSKPEQSIMESDHLPHLIHMPSSDFTSCSTQRRCKDNS